MMLFMILLTVIAASAIVAIALVRPKRHDHASKVSGYDLIECSYQPLSAAPTYRMQVTQPHEAHATERTVHGRIKNIQSKNRAGYVVARNLNRPVKNSINSVSASWSIPRLWPHLPTSVNRFSATSVCIDGFQSSKRSMIQIGTESDWDAINGQQINFAWFAISDRPPTLIVNFPVAIGDSISAAIKRGQKLKAKKNGQFELTIRNNTQGVAMVVPQEFTRSLHTECSTAQFVVETPYENHHIAPLADFGAQTFHECICTVDEQLAPILAKDRQFAPLHMMNAVSEPILQKVIARTSNLTPDGKSFTVTSVASAASAG